MSQLDNQLTRAALWCAVCLSGAVLVSTAAYNILIAATLVAMIAARIPIRLPPIKAPLAAFIALTLLATLLSSDPRAGLPQLKKFYLFLVLLVMYSVVRSLRDVLRCVYVWAAAAFASASWSLVQFLRKREASLAAGHDFYLDYIAARVTGFMSHWMTFSAEMMIALLMLTAVLLFVLHAKRSLPVLPVAGVIGAAIVIALTRSVWIATAVSLAYLVCVWSPKFLAVLPLMGGVLWLVAPAAVKERAISVYQPHGTVDSNAHRSVTRIVGLRMIAAHPWFGLGPEIPKRDFMSYVPPDLPRPLPDGFYGHLHNMYLQYAAERGLPTLAALLWLVAKAAADFVRGLRRIGPAEPLRKAILHGAIAVLVAVMIEGLGEYNLGDGEVLAMFLMVIAWGYTAVDSGSPVYG